MESKDSAAIPASTLAGQRRDPARITPSDLDDVDAVKTAQGAGMAPRLDPVPDHRHHRRAGAGQNRVARADPAAVRVAVM